MAGKKIAAAGADGSEKKVAEAVGNKSCIAGHKTIKHSFNFLKTYCIMNKLR